MRRKTIVFDFDGVIHKYSKGWQDGSIYDEPVDGIKDVINELHREYDIYIVSTRCRELSGQIAVQRYLEKYNIEYDCVTSIKVPAQVYVDDRGITFDPANIKTLASDIRNFLTWQQKQAQPENKLF